MMFNTVRLGQLKYWMTEREAIRVRKEAGKPKPWTEDTILRGTRFCNVRRMDDKVSRWLMDEWYAKVLKSTSDRGHYLGAAGMARLINWPDTLSYVRSRFPEIFTGEWHAWNTQSVANSIRFYRDAGNKVFTGAYIINAAGGRPAVDKIEVVCRQIHTLRLHEELLDTKNMRSTHEKLMRVPGIGSFMAGQIVADLRHVIKHGTWSDRMTWAPLGPGSRRGIGWLTGWNGIDRLGNIRQQEFDRYMAELIPWCAKNVRKIFEDRQLEAHDIQNCLCEFDKFMRLTMNTGRAKNHYP